MGGAGSSRGLTRAPRFLDTCAAHYARICVASAMLLILRGHEDLAHPPRLVPARGALLLGGVEGWVRCDDQSSPSAPVRPVRDCGSGRSHNRFRDDSTKACNQAKRPPLLRQPVSSGAAPPSRDASRSAAAEGRSAPLARGGRIERTLAARAMCSSGNNVRSNCTLLRCDRPSSLLSNGQQGMNPRPQFAGRGAAGRAGLQGVTTFDRATTCFAAADMHVETAINHRLRNLGLILHGDVRSRICPLAQSGQLSGNGAS